MGHISDQSQAALFCLFQILRHPVEGAGQIGQLIVSEFLNPHMKLSIGNSAAGFAHGTNGG